MAIFSRAHELILKWLLLSRTRVNLCINLGNLHAHPKYIMLLQIWAAPSCQWRRGWVISASFGVHPKSFKLGYIIIIYILSFFPCETHAGAPKASPSRHWPDLLSFVWDACRPYSSQDLPSNEKHKHLKLSLVTCPLYSFLNYIRNDET